MKTVGFPISHKENEYRRALLPDDVKKISHPDRLFFETGFGEVLGLTDEDYRRAGAKICSRAEVLQKDIVCDPKIGDGDYLEDLHPGQTIFGWIHATQNRDITDKIVGSGLTAYAWEKMFHGGRHIFWFNNELAGEAAVLHAFQCFGKLPFGLDVAVLGNGNTAKGAVRVLNMLGARVMQYGRKTEALFREELGRYDAVVNCVLWDVKRKDHIVFKEDLARMKRNAMIIDVSCDRAGGIETSVPTTIENPTYLVDGILHYAVDHTPSLFYKTFSDANSAVIYPYIQQLLLEKPDEVLRDCKIIENGKIIDREIIEYQGRKG